MENIQELYTNRFAKFSIPQEWLHELEQVHQ